MSGGGQQEGRAPISKGSWGQNPVASRAGDRHRHLLLGCPVAAGGPHCLCRTGSAPRDHPGPVHLQRNPAQGRPQSQSRARCREHRSTLCGAQRGPEGTPSLPQGGPPSRWKIRPLDELEFPLLGMAFSCDSNCQLLSVSVSYFRALLLNCVVLLCHRCPAGRQI